MSYLNTLFSQALALVPRHLFQKLEKRHQTRRSSRKFGFKGQFVVMTFIHLAMQRFTKDTYISNLN